MQIGNWLELHTREEPLQEHLQKYVTDGPMGKMFHHPLHIEMFFDPERAAWINHRVEYMVRETGKALSAGNYRRYVGFHERPYRLEAFKSIHESLSVLEYWEMLASNPLSGQKQITKLIGRRFEIIHVDRDPGYEEQILVCVPEGFPGADNSGMIVLNPTEYKIVE